MRKGTPLIKFEFFRFSLCEHLLHEQNKNNVVEGKTQKWKN